MSARRVCSSRNEATHSHPPTDDTTIQLYARVRCERPGIHARVLLVRRFRGLHGEVNPQGLVGNKRADVQVVGGRVGTWLIQARLQIQQCGPNGGRHLSVQSRLARPGKVEKFSPLVPEAGGVVVEELPHEGGSSEVERCVRVLHAARIGLAP